MSQKPDKLVRLDEATLTLLDGETVEIFRRALEQELAAFYRERGVESWSFYQVALFADAVVVEVREDGRSHHERVAFRRDGDRLVVGPAVKVRITMGAEPIAGDEESVAERATPPAGLFYAAPFYEGDGGVYDSHGRLVPARSRLPYPAEVREDRDVAHLRNALARFGLVDFAPFLNGADRRARATLETAADRAARQQPAHRETLAADLADFRAGRYRAIRERLEAEGAWMPEGEYLGITCPAR